jgi:hypothetical protein
MLRSRCKDQGHLDQPVVPFKKRAATITINKLV